MTPVNPTQGAEHDATEAEVLPKHRLDVTEAETPRKPESDATAGESPRRSASHTLLATPRNPDALGRLDHYEILATLGQGGFGTVYRAFDERLHRTVAIKVLAPELAAVATARARFLREARTAAAVRHENVVDIHFVAEAPVPYLVMEHVQGSTLHARIARSGPMELQEILHIGRQLACGLAAAHAQGLVHRDVKPSNVLIDESTGNIKLSDFGLARALDDAQLTQSGVIAGTPAYMSPEQADGETIDHRSDLFSLGTVLYVMCTGQPPFRASSSMATLRRICQESPRPIREFNAAVPDWLSRIIEKLHAKNPVDRYQTAQEVAEALGRCLASLPVHGHKALTPEQLPDMSSVTATEKPRGRGRVRNIVGGTLFGVVILIGAVGWYNRDAILRLVDPQPLPPPIAAKIEWLQLFNGQNLDGWKAMGWNGWCVQDGVLVGRTVSGKPGWLRSEREFADFELELEFKLTEKTDSGVFLRAWPEGNIYGDDFTEVQILDDRHFTTLDANRKHGAIFRKAAPQVPVSAEVGAWQRLRIRAEGRRIRVWQQNMTLVDHQIVASRSRGNIGLQLFPTQVEFRNIRIREIE